MWPQCSTGIVLFIKEIEVQNKGRWLRRWKEPDDLNPIFGFHVIPALRLWDRRQRQENQREVEEPVSLEFSEGSNKTREHASREDGRRELTPGKLPSDFHTHTEEDLERKSKIIVAEQTDQMFTLGTSVYSTHFKYDSWLKSMTCGCLLLWNYFHSIYL